MSTASLDRVGTLGAATAQLPQNVRDALPRVVGGAVDEFDAAARLESNGMGDIVARMAGFPNTFEHALSLMKDVSPPQESALGRGIRRGLWAALVRAVVMLAGVGVCVLAIPAGTSALVTFLAGGAAWLSAQTVSAAIWWGLGRGRPARGSALALGTALTQLVLWFVVGLATGHPEVCTWVMWGTTAAVWLSRRRLHLSLVATLVALTIALGGLALPTSLATAPATLALAMACTTAMAQLWRHATARVERPVAGGARSIILAVVQTIAPVTMLGVAAGRLGPDFLVVALGSLVASAACDPLVEVATQMVRGIAERGSSWRQVRRRTALAGVLVTLLAALGGLLAGLTTSYLLRGIAPGLAAACITLAVSTFSVGGAVMLRTGDAAGAAVLAVTTSGALAAVLASDMGLTSLWFVVFDCVAVAGISILAASRLSSPRVW